MADAPPRKRQRLDQEADKEREVSELYNPKLVTITAHGTKLPKDVLSRKKAGPKEEFVLPRGLICAHSKYFERVFKGNFAEAQTGRSELTDVKPWVLRCFVGWMYFSKIYYVDEKEGEQLLPIAGNHGGRSAADNTESSSDFLRSTGGESKKNSSDNGDDWNDPITWPYEELFELYVFSDAYDARMFREDVFDIISAKLTVQEIDYMEKKGILVSTADVAYATNNLPASSPLVQRLIDHFVLSVMDEFGRDLEELPPNILSKCLKVMARVAKANGCTQCCRQEYNKRFKCTKKDHTTADKNLIKSPCTYHEHTFGDAWGDGCARMVKVKDWVNARSKSVQEWELAQE